MRYYGSKSQSGKEISQVLLRICPPGSVKGYIEPFCGSLGVMRHMTELGYKRYYAYDYCLDLILLWKQLIEGKFRKPKMTKEKWKKLRNSESSALRAFAGFGCSFGGQWFRGYASDYEKVDSVSVAYRSLVNIKPKIKSVVFKQSDYKKLKPKGYLIYCDPPYSKTHCKGWGCKDVFNKHEFWDKVREWSKDNTVIVSEYSAPRGFKSIWKKERYNGMKHVLTDKNKHKKIQVERLYKINKHNAFKRNPKALS